MILPFLLSIVVSCGSDTPKTCMERQDSIQRSDCLHKEIIRLPSRDVSTVITKAKQISDPMIRGAAISAWVRSHSNEISQQQGKQLCALLDGRDQSYCMRRLSSPHLQR